LGRGVSRSIAEEFGKESFWVSDRAFKGRRRGGHTNTDDGGR